MNRNVLSAFFAMSLLFACSTKEKPATEHSVESSLADLKVYDGLEVTLFASEPMLTNPTNIDIDAKGRVWVCEAYNYRTELNPKNPVKDEGDRILILEDTDGDGKADKQTVFYQGKDINASLGICVLGNKIIVSCAPNVFVFTDEDGDDVPEKKEILYQGIQGVQHDHAVHSFNFAHDGRLYFTMGNEGKSLVDAKGDTVVDIHGNKVVTDGKPYRQGLVLRTALDGSNVEVVANNFRNNYEAAVDPYGTIWQSDNDDDGNKGTRINYVMEFGNYGYTNALTGEGWRARRTNMEKEIPLRHWYLNDPGNVPNLLQTGSGSPTGMTVYEGTLLPEIFYGQMIHAEPGHNVVRAYPVENDGAGYTATIVNILEGQNDQWFRPSDVAIAPDGSLFVADWYDPGVGGHQVGDLERGRIYRIAPPKNSYKTPSVSFENPDEAAKALLSPNAATRYLAWTALAKAGTSGEAALKKIWESSNARHRAQALWLLARLEAAGDAYISQALNDKDANIRITGIRVVRELKKDVVSLVTPLAKDPSPQVRRDVAIALRGNNSAEAATLWAELAAQHDGKDRWYLEALGLSADGNWDQRFMAWKQLASVDLKSAAAADIIWRSRSKYAIPLLADLIRSANDTDMLRYYRAFDFHSDPSKQQALIKLALDSKGEKAMYALKHMDATKATITPALTAKLNEVLKLYENKIEYVEMVKAFKLQSKAPDLLALGIHYPDSLAGKEALKVVSEWGKYDMYKQVVAKKNPEELMPLLKGLQAQMYDKKIIAIVQNIALDSSYSLSVRNAAIRSFGGNGESEKALLELAKEKKIPKDLTNAAASVFQNIWRPDMRAEAAKYVPLPSTKGGTSLPDINELASKKGDAIKGKEVFKNICSTCHQVNGDGTNFGPGLSEIGDKLPKNAIYKSILYPDQGISFGYEGYSLKLKDGTEAFGMITSESESEIEIVYMTNKQTVKKIDVVSKTQLGSSLMPSNLQAGMTEEELVDLVEYLNELKKK